MDSLVSVIIPCYNAEKHLDKSIGSVYMQDYPNIELIIINDGSTDDSEQKILNWKEKFEKKGFLLKYIVQENQGPGAATNVGLKYVSGTYLTLLDADDCYLQGSIRYRAEFLDKHLDYAGVRSNGWLVTATERKPFIVDENEKKISDLFTALSLGRTNNWAGTYMVRTDILFDFYPDRNIIPSRLGQNFQILLPVAYNHNFGYVDQPLMEYYIYTDSHSHAHDTEKQYKITEANAKGWRDIYLSILAKLAHDTHEYHAYENMYNAVYYRGCLYRAAACSKQEALCINYNLLKGTGRTNLEDRVVYYTAINSPVAFYWKLMLKCTSIYKRICEVMFSGKTLQI